MSYLELKKDLEKSGTTITHIDGDGVRFTAEIPIHTASIDALKRSFELILQSMTFDKRIDVVIGWDLLDDNGELYCPECKERDAKDIESDDQQPSLL